MVDKPPIDGGADTVSAVQLPDGEVGLLEPAESDRRIDLVIMTGGIADVAEGNGDGADGGAAREQKADEDQNKDERRFSGTWGLLLLIQIIPLARKW